MCGYVQEKRKLNPNDSSWLWPNVGESIYNDFSSLAGIPIQPGAQFSRTRFLSAHASPTPSDRLQTLVCASGVGSRRHT